MTKEEFNQLEILMQIKYINKLHKEGTSLTKISKELDFGRATIRTRFAKEDYIYSKELMQYCKSKDLDTQLHQEIIKVPQKAIKQVIEPNDRDSTKELQKHENREKSQNYNKDILELINKKTEILEMLENYKNNTKVIGTTNISSLPEKMKTKIINKSVKVYEEVYKKFDKVCCSQFNGSKKQDIISQALYEFCENHKK